MPRMKVGDSKAGMGIVVDDNNVYVTGLYSAPFKHGTTNIACAGGSDVYVAALGKDDGIYEWTASLGGPDMDLVTTMTMGKGGDLLIGGNFRSKATFSSTNKTKLTETAEGFTDIYVASLDTKGVFRWIKTIGNENSTASLRSIAVDSSTGDIHMAGGFIGDMTLGKNTWTKTDTSVIAYMDATGTTITGAIPSGASIDDDIDDIVVDSANKQVHAAGYLQLGGKYGETTLAAKGTHWDMLILKLSY